MQKFKLANAKGGLRVSDFAMLITEGFTLKLKTTSSTGGFLFADI